MNEKDTKSETFHKGTTQKPIPYTSSKATFKFNRGEKPIIRKASAS